MRTATQIVNLLYRRLAVGCVLVALSASAAEQSFEGEYFCGRGDVEYLRLLDISRRMFAPDPQYQNISMLYTTNWNGFVEGEDVGRVVDSKQLRDDLRGAAIFARALSHISAKRAGSLVRPNGRWQAQRRQAQWAHHRTRWLPVRLCHAWSDRLLARRRTNRHS